MNVAWYADADILRTDCKNEGLFENVEKGKIFASSIAQFLF